MILILQALEQGLDGVVLKVEDMDDIIKLKVSEFFRNFFGA
jgi:3-dehydroquinate synthase class II